MLTIAPATRDKVSRRKEDAVGQIANFWRMAGEIVNDIDRGRLDARTLVDYMHRYRVSRNALTDPNGIGFGDLLDAGTKARMVEDHPNHYPDVPSLNADLASAAQLADDIRTAMRALLDARKAARSNLLDSDPTTDQVVDPVFSSAEAAVLRAAAVALRDSIDSTDGG